MQGLAKQGLLKGAKTCKLKFCEYYILGKKTKLKFDTAICMVSRGAKLHLGLLAQYTMLTEF